MKSQNEETKPSNILLKLSWDTGIKMLTVKERGVLLTNFFNYHTGETLLPMSKTTQIFFASIVDTFEYNKLRYQNKVSANQLNGLKGGRPKGSSSLLAGKEVKTQNNPSGFLENPNNPKDKDKAIGKDRGTDISIDTDIVTEIEKDIATGKIKATDPRFKNYYVAKFEKLFELNSSSISDPDDRSYLQRAKNIYSKLGAELFSLLIFESTSTDAQAIISDPEYKYILPDIEYVRYHMIGYLKKLVK